MSDLIGDTSELVRNSIVAKATHQVVGVSGHFHFKICDAPGLASYFLSHAKVSITGPVSVYIAGPVTPTTATSAVVAICPDKYSDWPTTEAQIIQLQGSVRVQHSLLVPATHTPIEFGHEITELLKPRTLIDYPPVVVGHFTVSGGTTTSATTIIVEVPITVSGLSHNRTW